MRSYKITNLYSKANDIDCGLQIVHGWEAKAAIKVEISQQGESEEETHNSQQKHSKCG